MFIMYKIITNLPIVQLFFIAILSLLIVPALTGGTYENVTTMEQDYQFSYNLTAGTTKAKGKIYIILGRAYFYLRIATNVQQGKKTKNPNYQIVQTNQQNQFQFQISQHFIQNIQIGYSRSVVENQTIRLFILKQSSFVVYNMSLQLIKSNGTSNIQWFTYKYIDYSLYTKPSSKTFLFSIDPCITKHHINLCSSEDYQINLCSIWSSGPRFGNIRDCQLMRLTPNIYNPNPFFQFDIDGQIQKRLNFQKWVYINVQYGSKSQYYFNYQKIQVCASIYLQKYIGEEQRQCLKLKCQYNNQILNPINLQCQYIKTKDKYNTPSSSSNATQYQDTMGTKIGLIVPITIASFVGITLLAIIIVVKYRKYRQRTMLVQPPSPQIAPAQLNSQRRLKSTTKNQQQLCAICLDNKCDSMLQCCHWFHYRCIYEYSLRGNRCPVCRRGFSMHHLLRI